MRTSPRFAYSVPKIGKGSSSLSGPSRVLSLAGPLHHQSQRASGLRFAVVLCTLGPQPLILYIRNIKPDDMNIPLLGYRALSGWSEALFTQRRGMVILRSSPPLLERWGAFITWRRGRGSRLSPL